MNRQIGWFIEVTKINEAKTPEHWKRKQQMTNGSRYVTDELLERDDALLTADTKLKELEYREFINLREACKGHAQILLERLQRSMCCNALAPLPEVERGLARKWLRATK